MSPAIAYALGALLLYGLADFVYKRAAAAGAAPHRFMMVQTWFFNPLALLYAVLSGTLAFKLGLRQGAAPIALVVSQGVVALTLATSFAAVIDRGVRPSRVALTHAPLAALLLVAAFILLAKGLEQGEASVVVPVARMGFV